MGPHSRKQKAKPSVGKINLARGAVGGAVRADPRGDLRPLGRDPPHAEHPSARTALPARPRAGQGRRLSLNEKTK